MTKDSKTQRVLRRLNVTAGVEWHGQKLGTTHEQDLVLQKAGISDGDWFVISSRKKAGALRVPVVPVRWCPGGTAEEPEVCIRGMRRLRIAPKKRVLWIWKEAEG